jgi:hypothetical protein
MVLSSYTAVLRMLAMVRTSRVLSLFVYLRMFGHGENVPNPFLIYMRVRMPLVLSLYVLPKNVGHGPHQTYLRMLATVRVSPVLSRSTATNLASGMIS